MVNDANNRIQIFRIVKDNLGFYVTSISTCMNYCCVAHFDSITLLNSDKKVEECDARKA